MAFDTITLFSSRGQPMQVSLDHPPNDLTAAERKVVELARQKRRDPGSSIGAPQRADAAKVRLLQTEKSNNREATSATSGEYDLSLPSPPAPEPLLLSNETNKYDHLERTKANSDRIKENVKRGFKTALSLLEAIGKKEQLLEWFDWIVDLF